MSGWGSVSPRVLGGITLVVVAGGIAAGAVVALRSRSDGGHEGTTPPLGGVVIGDGVTLPIAVDGDRLGLSSLDGAAPSPVTGFGRYSDVQYDAAGRLLYVDSSGEHPGMYRVEGGGATDDRSVGRVQGRPALVA